MCILLSYTLTEYSMTRTEYCAKEQQDHGTNNL